MRALLQPLADLAGYDDLCRQLRKGRGVVGVTGCLESQKAHLAAGLAEGHSVVLLIAENELKARALFEYCRLYDPDALYFPRRDLIFYQADISGNLLCNGTVITFSCFLFVFFQKFLNHCFIRI